MSTETTKVEVNNGQTTEAVEVETAALNEGNVVATKTNQPLVPGFRDKMVILPLAHLQRDLENLKKLVQGGFKELQDINNQQLQYVYRGVAEISTNTRSLGLQLEAIVRMLKLDEDAIEATVKEIEAEEAAKNEAKADAKQGLKVVERAAAIGDVLKINFVGRVDGEAFKGGTANGSRLELGSKQFIPGFEEQLVGASAGQTLTVKVTFPEDYGNKELAGKAAEFETTVVAVKEKVKKAEASTEEAAAQG